MSKIREVKEGVQFVGVEEKPAFRLNTLPWGGTPTSPSLVIKQMPAGSDVTSAHTEGTIGVSGDWITLPRFKDFAEGVLYRVEIKFTSQGNPLEAVAFFRGET